MAVHLLFCRVQLLTFVQNSMHHSCVVPISSFSSGDSLHTKSSKHTVVLTRLQLGRFAVLSYPRYQISGWPLVVDSSPCFTPYM